MPTKEVKKKFYLYIINNVRNHYKLPSLSISKQARNYYVRKLRIDGIIHKIGYGTWDITSNKVYLAKYILELQQVKIMPIGGQAPFKYSINKRGHGFILKIKLYKIKNWIKRIDYLYKKNIKFKPINSKTQRIVHQDYKVWLSDTSIVIYTPKGKSYYGKTAEESQRIALDTLFRILRGVERLLNCSFHRHGEYEFNLSRQHYGKVNDNLAKHYNTNGLKLEVRNEEGRWLLIDHSLNLDELETVHRKSAVKDMDKVIVPFFNDLKAYYEETGESFRISQVLEVFKQMTLTHAHHTKQIGDIIKWIKEKN